jgi:hemoglobin-like flavoprotein
MDAASIAFVQSTFQTSLHAMTSCAPDAMTPDAIAAWRRAYHLIAETMMHGATHGPSAPSRAG